MSKKRKRSAQDSSKAAPLSKKQQTDLPPSSSSKYSAKQSAKTGSKSNGAKQNVKPTTAPAPKPEAPREPLDSSPFVEVPKGPELAREVKLYDLLASEDDLDRLDAAQAIVTALLPSDGTNPPVSEAALRRHLERKLFRGLASGRKAARLGFSIALTEILSQLFAKNENGKTLVEESYPGITFENTIAALQAKTKPEGDLSGQEERDHHFGLLFGLQSFVRAEILFSAEDDASRWNMVLDIFLQLANKKAWMREECGWVIVEALNQMTAPAAQSTIEKICDAGFALTPEGVGIWLVARQKFPEMDLPQKPWGPSANPMDRLQTLAKALKESSNAADDVDGQQAKSSGTWNPKLHFVWDIVLRQYILDAEAGRDGVESEFHTFWKVAVDENLFSGSSSRERKFWGFQLFQKMIQDATSQPKLLNSIFSINLVRCLVNQLSNQDRFLNRAADKSLKVILQEVEAHPELLVVILPNIVDGNGMYNFDHVTKTKTVEKLLSFVDDSTGEEVINVLFNLTKAPKIETEAEPRRQFFGDTVLAMIRRANPTDETQKHDWIQNAALPKMAELAYSDIQDVKPKLSQKTRTMLQERLGSALAHCLSHSKGYMAPCDLLQEIKADGIEMDEEIAKAKDKALSTMTKLVKKAAKASESAQASLRALALLYALIIFQLYNGEADALSILDELKLCYDKLVRGKEDEDAEVDPSELIVGILLSLVSKPSLFLRKAAQSVFAAFTADVTPGALKLMTDVLESSEDLKGQQELFEQDPEGDEMEVDSESEGDDEDELDSDVEVVDAENGGGDEDSEEDENDVEEDEEEEDGPDDEEVLFNAALAKALGTHRADEDKDAISSDSDADMTDSEMMELDSKLVEIFKQRQPLSQDKNKKKQERKDAKEHMANFKARVLDLLEVYIKNEAATSSQPLHLLVPLVRLIRTTATRRLADRVPAMLTTFSKVAKRKGADKEKEADAEKKVKKSKKKAASAEQIAILKALHEEASLDPSQSFAKAISSASLLVASYLYRANPAENAGRIADVYRDTQLSVLQGEAKIRPVLFNDWTNWCLSRGATG